MDASGVSRSSSTLGGAGWRTLAHSWVDVVKPEIQNDSRAADYETMIDEYLDHELEGSGRQRSHLTRF